MAWQKAVIVQENKTVAVEQREMPGKLGDYDVLLKIISVGLSGCNGAFYHRVVQSEQYLADPTDWKHVAFGLAKPGNMLGCDFVGVAEEIGPHVPAEVKGQLRGGYVRGGVESNTGAFAEYVKSAWDVTFRIPNNVSPAQAASIPIPLFTACQALYLRLGIPRPGQDSSSLHGKWILVWGGTSSVGQYAIQLAKLAGLRIATTASPAKHALVKSLGADVVFDYKVSMQFLRPNMSAEGALQIQDGPSKLQSATECSIEYGLDCVSSKDTIRLSQQAFGTNGGRLVCLLFDLGEPSRPDVQTQSTVSSTLLGEDKTFPELSKNWETDRKAMTEFCQVVPELFEQGKLRPLDVTDLGSIEHVQKGLEQLKNGENKTKLVHTIAAY